MAVRFTSCYPELPQGARTPCGVVTDKQSGYVQEIICPELTEAVCSSLAAGWNERPASSDDGSCFEDRLARFISDELKRIQG